MGSCMLFLNSVGRRNLPQGFADELSELHFLAYSELIIANM